MTRTRVTVFDLAGAGVLLVAALVAGCAAATPTAVPAQPEPIATGVPAPTLEAAYRAAQANPALDDEARVRAAVDTYFTLKYESWVAGQALDLGIVIDRSTPAGEALHDYELGRLQYSLFCWRDQDFRIVAYHYQPAYEGIEIEGDTAVARLTAWVDMRAGDCPDTPEILADGGSHAITLVRRPAGWQITRDEYEDEFKEMNPPGTDWAAQQVSYPEEKREWQTRQAELEQQMGPRPTDAVPTSEG